jgi:hypothetical protein
VFKNGFPRGISRLEFNVALNLIANVGPVRVRQLLEVFADHTQGATGLNAVPGTLKCGDQTPHS